MTPASGRMSAGGRGSAAAKSDILFVISSLGSGGAERVVSLLADGLVNAGKDVAVATYEPAPPDHFPLDRRVRRLRVPLLWPSTGPIDMVFSAVRRWAMLRGAVLSARPRCVVAFGDLTNVRTLLSTVGGGVPIVVAECSDPRHQQLPRIWEWLRRRLYPRAAAVVVQTESVAQWARRIVEPARVHVIPNPVRPAVPEAPRPDALPGGNVVMAVGRFTPEKGFALLIEAFARSGLPAAGWHLVILGDGPERAALQARIGELKLGDRVRLPGLVAEPAHWLRHADLFVLSSRYEGFPNALLEAMACGVAALAFDCPSGPGEIIRHGETGLLLPAADVDALAQAMRELAADPQRRRRLGRAAAGDVTARFALPAVVRQWEVLLASVSRGQRYQCRQ